MDKGEERSASADDLVFTEATENTNFMQKSHEVLPSELRLAQNNRSSVSLNASDDDVQENALL